jgi:hypothetical protein
MRLLSGIEIEKDEINEWYLEILYCVIVIILLIALTPAII